MINESNLELFDKWTETKDKEEFIKLGLQLFPTITRKDLEDNFEEAMSGYRAGSAMAKARHEITS